MHAFAYDWDGHVIRKVPPERDEKAVARRGFQPGDGQDWHSCVDMRTRTHTQPTREVQSQCCCCWGRGQRYVRRL